MPLGMRQHTLSTHKVTPAPIRSMHLATAANAPGFTLQVVDKVEVLAADATCSRVLSGNGTVRSQLAGDQVLDLKELLTCSEVFDLLEPGVSRGSFLRDVLSLDDLGVNVDPHCVDGTSKSLDFSIFGI